MIFQEFSSRLFGYDIFISFALGQPPRGTHSYASDLARRLRERDFSVFFSEEEAPPGEELNTTLRKALQSSKALLVVANRGTLLDPRWVRTEVEEFLKYHTNRPVIAINVGGAFQDPAIAESAQEWIGFEGKIWLDESEEAVEHGIATEPLIERLATAPNWAKSNFWWRWVVRSSIMLLICAIATLVVMLNSVNNAKKEANEQSNQALASERKAKEQKDNANRQKEIAQTNQKEAEEKERVAQSQRLAAESKSLVNELPQRSLLLGIEAVRAALQVKGKRVAQAEEALRYAIAQTGGRAIWRTRTPITVVVMKQRWLAAASEDGLVMLWDLSKGSEGSPCELKGHTKKIRSLVITPDEHWLVSGGDDKTIRRWDLSHRNPQKTMKILPHNQGPVSTMLTAGDQLIFSVDGDSKVYISNISTMSPNNVRELQQDAVVTALAVSDALLVTGDKVGNVHVVDISDPQLGQRHWHYVHRIDGENDDKIGRAVTSVAISKNNRWVITGGRDDQLLLIDLNENSVRPGSQGIEIAPERLFSFPEYVNVVSITPNGKYALCAGGSQTIYRWELKDSPRGKEALFYGHNGSIDSLAVSSDSEWLLTGSDDRTSRVWYLQRPSHSTVLRGHDDSVSSVAISSDNVWAATGSRDGTVRLWKLAAPRISSFPMQQSPTPQILQGNPYQNLVSDYTPHAKCNGGQVFTVAISPDNKWVATGGKLGPDDEEGCGGVTWLWKLSPNSLFTQTEAQRLPDSWFRKPVKVAVFSSNSRLLATGDDAGELKIWRLDKGKFTELLHDGSQKRGVSAIAISSNNHWLASGSEDGVVRIWDLTSPQHLTVRDLPGDKSAVTALVITPDSQRLVTGSRDGTLRLWDRNPSSPNAKFVKLSGHRQAVTAMAISRDGRWLASASKDQTARIWDLQSADPNQTSKVLEGHQGALTAIAIASDGHWVVTGSIDKKARLWDLTSANSNKSVKILNGHENTVSSVAITNSWVVTAGYDGTARLWNPSAPDPSVGSTVLRGHLGINTVAVSNDGRYLLTGGSYDYHTRLWLLQNKDLTKIARAVAGRNLTTEESRLYLVQQKPSVIQPNPWLKWFLNWLEEKQDPLGKYVDSYRWKGRKINEQWRETIFK